MLQRIDQFRMNPSVEIPEQYDEFATLSIDLLRHAHQQGLDRDLATVRVSTDYEAHRLYIESQHDRLVDREHLAIHLGRSGQWLSVSFQQQLDPAERGALSYPRSTVVIESAGVQVHHTDYTSLGPSEHIEDNEIAGRYFTDRLYRSFGYFGIYSAEQLEQLQKAS